MSLETAVQENTAAIRELTAAIKAGIPTTAAQVAAVVAEAPAEEKKVTEKTTSAAKAAKSDSTTTVAGSSAQSEKPMTLDELRAIGSRVLKTGRANMVALLEQFGIPNLTQAKPDQYAEIAAAAREMLGEAA